MASRSSSLGRPEGTRFRAPIRSPAHRSPPARLTLPHARLAPRPPRSPLLARGRVRRASCRQPDRPPHRRIAHPRGISATRHSASRGRLTASQLQPAVGAQGTQSRSSGGGQSGYAVELAASREQSGSPQVLVELIRVEGDEAGACRGDSRGRSARRRAHPGGRLALPPWLVHGAAHRERRDSVRIGKPESPQRGVRSRRR